MANLIIDNLLKQNKEFNIIYNTFLAKGKIRSFDSISDLLQFNGCFDNKKLNLNYLFQNDLNLFSPYVSAINVIRAILEKKVLDEYINIKPKLVFGKQYLTKNFPNIYDCTSLWIETEKYIIDPVLSIIIDKDIKDKLFYKDIFVDTKYRLTDNKKFVLFEMDFVVYLSRFLSKFDSEHIKYPTTIKDMYVNNYANINKSNKIRKYLKTVNPFFYQKLEKMIEDGEVIDLNERMKEYDNIFISKKYNPDLTLGQVLRKGLNYGRCGLIAKAFSETIYKDVRHSYCIGFNQNIAGSKNSFDGNHAWIETNDSIIDTSLMMEIPKRKYAYSLGYRTTRHELNIPGREYDNYLSEEFRLETSMHLYDVVYENQKNNAKIFQFNFSESLPDIMENNPECKHHFTKESLTAKDLLDEDQLKYVYGYEESNN